MNQSKNNGTGEDSMDTAYFYLTPEGGKLAQILSAKRPGDLYGKDNFKEKLCRAFNQYDNLVCIMAAGIVVRILAPVIVHKTSDPAVVVMDQKGHYAISLLSGHLGGANDLAREMAGISGGLPVITTATDVAGELSFDSFAKKYGMAIENISSLKHISGALLRGEPVRVFTDRSYPDLEGRDLLRIIPAAALFDSGGDAIKKNSSQADKARPCSEEGKGAYMESMENLPAVVIHEGAVLPAPKGVPVLYLRPKTICAGIGCKRGMPAEAIKDALLQTMKEEGLSPLSLRCLSTIPLKADEAGIIETARFFQVDIKIIPTEDIKSLDISSLGISSSDFVAENTGVPSVSTASAYLASGRGTILRDKAKYKGITVALARTPDNTFSTVKALPAGHA